MNKLEACSAPWRGVFWGEGVGFTGGTDRSDGGHLSPGTYLTDGAVALELNKSPSGWAGFGTTDASLTAIMQDERSMLCKRRLAYEVARIHVDGN